MPASAPLTPPAPPPLKVGIVVHRPGDDAEDMFARVLIEAQRDGLRIAGVFQVTGETGEMGKTGDRTGGGKAPMTLVDIATGRRIGISQTLGRGSTSCRLDPDGLAEASVILHQALADSPDLLVANKFAGLEAEGRGLAPELFAAIAEGIPVLTLVRDRYLPAWERLTGGIGDRLPPTAEAVRAWIAGLRRPEAT